MRYFKAHDWQGKMVEFATNDNWAGLFLVINHKNGIDWELRQLEGNCDTRGEHAVRSSARYYAINCL